MWPVKVWFRALHVPQRCQFDCHHKKFVDAERVAVFASHEAVLRRLSQWYNQQGNGGGCHVYEVVRVERAERKAEIEFN